MAIIKIIGNNLQKQENIMKKVISGITALLLVAIITPLASAEIYFYENFEGSQYVLDADIDSNTPTTNGGTWFVSTDGTYGSVRVKSGGTDHGKVIQCRNA